MLYVGGLGKTKNNVESLHRRVGEEFEALFPTSWMTIFGDGERPKLHSKQTDAYS